MFYPCSWWLRRDRCYPGRATNKHININIQISPPPSLSSDSDEPIPYLDQCSIIAVWSLESLAVLSGRGIVNSDAAILAGRQNVFLALVRFHIVKGGLADNIMSSGKLHLTAAISLLEKQKNRKKDVSSFIFIFFLTTFALLNGHYLNKRKTKETNGYRPVAAGGIWATYRHRKRPSERVHDLKRTAQKWWTTNGHPTSVQNCNPVVTAGEEHKRSIKYSECV